VDYDVVEYKHTRDGRTIYQASSIGTSKVYAAKYKIEGDYPDSIIHPVLGNVKDLINEGFFTSDQKDNIVINAIDDAKAMLKVNDRLYHDVEIIYVAMHAGAESGHIIITIPEASACLRCSLDVRSHRDIHTLHGEPGLAVNIRHVANQCAAIAFEILYFKATGRPIERWDIKKNVFYFANKREQLSPDGPAVILQEAEKRPGCRICSVIPSKPLLKDYHYD